MGALPQRKMVIPAGFEPATSRFIPTTTFVATLRCLWSGLSLHHNSQWTVGATRQVSTPFPSGTWFGIAISQVSPTLSSSTYRVSSTAPNLLGILRSIQLNYGTTSPSIYSPFWYIKKLHNNDPQNFKMSWKSFILMQPNEYKCKNTNLG